MEKVELVSLGYNCEISFRLENYFGKLHSYLFSWSYEEDRDLFLSALENIDGVFSNNISLRPDGMFADEDYKIKFHPRYDILRDPNNDAQLNNKNALNELHSRIGHLKEKTLALLKDKKKIIFIIKIRHQDEESNAKFISKLFGVLKSIVYGDNFILVSVLQKGDITPRIQSLESDQIKIRTVKKFAPQKHTNIAGDIKGWYKILSEFADIKSKCYFANVRKLRLKTIPTMVLNKVCGMLRIKK